jgi:hypothetical protein
VIVPATALYAIVCPPTTTLPSVTESGAAVGVRPPATAAAAGLPAPDLSCANTVEEITKTTTAAELNNDSLRLCREQNMNCTS